MNKIYIAESDTYNFIIEKGLGNFDIKVVDKNKNNLVAEATGSTLDVGYFMALTQNEVDTSSPNMQNLLSVITDEDGDFNAVQFDPAFVDVVALNRKSVKKSDVDIEGTKDAHNQRNIVLLDYIEVFKSSTKPIKEILSCFEPIAKEFLDGVAVYANFSLVADEVPEKFWDFDAEKCLADNGYAFVDFNTAWFDWSVLNQDEEDVELTEEDCEHCEFRDECENSLAVHDEWEDEDEDDGDGNDMEAFYDFLKKIAKSDKGESRKPRNINIDLSGLDAETKNTFSHLLDLLSK